MLTLITPGNIYGEDVAKDAKMRGIELSDEEFEDVQDFLFDYDPLYVAVVGAISAALDEVVLKRMAKSAGLYVEEPELEDKKDDQSTSEPMPF